MSDDDLFPNIRSLSPLAKWRAKHGLVTVQEDPAVVGQESPETGELCSAFYCLRDDQTGSGQDVDRIGRGDTEEEACEDYARRNQVLTWRQEELGK